LAYVGNAGSNTLSVIDLGSNTVIDTQPIMSPVGVAVNADGTRVYVANQGQMKVTVIDTTTSAPPAQVNVGSLPGGVAVLPSGAKVYATNQSDNAVSVIDSGNNSVITTVPVGISPFGIAADPSGTRVFVANTGSGAGSAGSVSVIDTQSDDVVAAVPLTGTPYGVAVANRPAGTQVYVSNFAASTVWVIDTPRPVGSGLPLL
jgi:YVTN family beta-propeller protein